MPIASFIMTMDPSERAKTLELCLDSPEVEVYGSNSQGETVLVIDSETSGRMEDLARQLQNLEGVLSLVPVYLHAEDEIAGIKRGDIQPDFSFGRKSEKQAPLS